MDLTQSKDGRKILVVENKDIKFDVNKIIDSSLFRFHNRKILVKFQEILEEEIFMEM